MPEELKRLTEQLSEEVHGLRKELAQDRKDRHADRRRDWARLAAIVAALVLGGLIGLGGAYALIERNNQRFCGLLQLSASADPPPMTDRGQQAQREAQELVERFGCS